MNAPGFTLVELLIAMLAASLLLLPLGWGVARLAQDLRAVEADAPVSRAALDRRLVSELLAGAYFTGADGEPLLQATDRIEFRARLPLALGGEGLGRYRLKIVDADDGQALRLSLVEPAGRQPVTLFEGSTALSIAIAGEPPFPRTLTISGKDSAERPFSVIARPRVTAPGNCIFDLVSRECR